MQPFGGTLVHEIEIETMARALTIAAKALREAGADSVLPFALALRG